MNKKRWLVLITACLLALAVWGVFYYRSVQMPNWTVTREVRQAVTETAGLEHIDSLTKHIWDEVTWIAQGSDASGQSVIVFLQNGEVIFRTEEENAMTKEDMLQLFDRQHADAKLVAIKPGWFRDQPAWEMQYKQQGSNGVFYHFYSLRNGEALDHFFIATY
ncbi:hypothetical protein M6D81_06270 [Paenibacillus sp. J5C_2022]|uniref:hypothetical protein n=1 Tax=Paenibacillus sp. J5C2022 TaxID=2977129 RepID=UPI0021CE4C80|nr:hypothetical protein [Paenibacillus sp. J5C2022]MCU6708315.1 hypothetical protein [Paenibacillus sp. J5C2022]